MRIVFFGTPQFSADILASFFINSEQTIVGVVCQPDKPVGRKHLLTAPPTKVLAQQHGIPVWQPTKLKDPNFVYQLQDLSADVFVVVAYGRIIPEAILNIPPYGCINLHPSLLPKYRGPSPMTASLVSGDSETGISIMKLDVGMDTGPILSQQRLAIDPQETIATLTQKVVMEGAPLLQKALNEYVAGKIQPHAQEEHLATYCHLLKKEDGQVDFTKQTAEDIERRVRAYTPWPGVSAHIWGVDVKLLSTMVAKDATKIVAGETFIVDKKRLLVGTATSALEVLTLQPSTKSPMNAEAFIQGYAPKAA